MHCAGIVRFGVAIPTHLYIVWLLVREEKELELAVQFTFDSEMKDGAPGRRCLTTIVSASLSKPVAVVHMQCGVMQRGAVSD